MTKKDISKKAIFPVLMAFFVGSFCDLVGIGVDRVKLDFELSNTLAQLIPSAVFLWFFILSVPVGILQDRMGKKKVLNIGIIITILGLLVPFFFYTFEMVIAGFAFLGIGNTVVQVSSNPLLVDVVPSHKRSSFLSLSQFIKAIGSMIAAPLAGWLAAKYGDWKLVLMVFGAVSILSFLWLSSTKIEEAETTDKRVTFSSAFGLLGNGFIAVMVLCIFLVVGIDVGINSVSGQFLLAKFGSVQTLAESARTLYFFGKMLGTLTGAIMLTRFSSNRFFIWSSFLGLISILAFIFSPTEIAALVLMFIIGLSVANIFPLVFSITVGRYTERSNEISGLMIMAISGGALLPPLMGWVADQTSVSASIFVLVVAIAFILAVSLSFAKKKYE